MVCVTVMEGINRVQAAEYQLEEELLEVTEVTGATESEKHNEVISSFIHKMETDVQFFVPEFDNGILLSTLLHIRNRELLKSNYLYT